MHLNLEINSYETKLCHMYYAVLQCSQIFPSTVVHYVICKVSLQILVVHALQLCLGPLTIMVTFTLQNLHNCGHIAKL